MRNSFIRRFHVKGLTLVGFLCILSPFICDFSFAEVSAAPIPVAVVTPQGQKSLKSWSSDDFRKLLRADGLISVQKFFDLSTETLDWKERADIDLLNIYGQKPNEVVRIPRFMVVREWIRFHFHRLSGRVSVEVSPKAQISMPKSALELDSVQKVELTKRTTVYQGIQLKIRTNPAASRGEKLYTENCLSCHSIPGRKPVRPDQLTKSVFDQFETAHRAFKNFTLTARDIRGLEVYREALASEKNEVKSSP